MPNVEMLRVVVIGAGVVACRFKEELMRTGATIRLTLISNEPTYDRTRLVKILDGSLTEHELMSNEDIVHGQVEAIHRSERQVCYRSDGASTTIPYDVLVIASGAEPWRPDIPGVHQAIALRRLQDIQHIVEQAPQHVTIVGGGVLGVELAHAMNASGHEVALIHNGSRIMERQLDEETSRQLQVQMENEGITFHLKSTLTAIHGNRVETDAPTINTDLAILATGVIANDTLARQAGLACERGVLVDEYQRSNDPHIYAIGDCCHNSPGLVQSGFHQARLAAQAITATIMTQPQPFPIPVTRLKTHHHLFSMGRVDGTSLPYHSARGTRKLFLDGERLVGAIVLGDETLLPKLQQAVEQGECLSWWQRLSFRLAGNPWPLTRQDPQHWPPNSPICQCKQVNLGTITQARQNGCHSVGELGKQTGAGTGCGGCKPLLAQLLNTQIKPVRHYKGLVVSATLSLLLAMVLFFFSIPYSESFNASWDVIWRDPILKQISGYTLLGMGVLLTLLAIRKHTGRLALGHYDSWRYLHSSLGVLALLGVFVHSGGRLGEGIAFLLTVSWLLVALVGGILAILSARAHKLSLNLHGSVRRLTHRIHVYFLWPLPVFMAYHIAGIYLWQ